MLVARIVAEPPGTREERASALVDAVAELFERDGSTARSALLDLGADDDAQRRLATWLGCRIAWAIGLVGAIPGVLQRSTTPPERREQLATALSLWLKD